MKKQLRQWMAGLLALGMVLMPVQALAQTYFWWQVVDEFGRPYPSQTVSCSVYDLASHGAKELFSLPTLARHAGVLTTMPLLSDADSRLHFYSDSTSDIRVVCYYARGGAATDVRLSRFTHTVMIDRQGRKVVRFPIVTNTAVTNTGIWLPQGALVRDVIVNMGATFVDKFADDTQTDPHLNVGFRGAHAVSVAHSLVDRMHLIGMPAWVRVGGEGTGRIIPKTGGVGAITHYGAAGGFGIHRGVLLAATARGAVSTPAGLTESAPYVETSYMVHLAGGLELTYQTSNRTGISGHVFVIYESYHVGVTTTPVGR